MFAKILLVLLALGIGLLVLRAALGKAKRDENDPPKGAPPQDRSPEDKPSRLYPCTRCGAMTPQEDVVWRDGQPFCSRPHADL